MFHELEEIAYLPTCSKAIERFLSTFYLIKNFIGTSFVVG